MEQSTRNKPGTIGPGRQGLQLSFLLCNPNGVVSFYRQPTLGEALQSKSTGIGCEYLGRCIDDPQRFDYCPVIH